VEEKAPTSDFLYLIPYLLQRGIVHYREYKKITIVNKSGQNEPALGFPFI